MGNLDFGLIGNCTISALVDPHGRIVWTCMPRFDGDPVFCSLLNNDGADGHGSFTIEVQNFTHAEQHYLRNTAILVTLLHDKDGGVVEVTDFIPRCKRYGRTFRPIMIVRRVRPIAGSPLIRVRLQPTYDFGAGRPSITFGSNHIRYVSPEMVVRLTTDASVTAVMEQTPFILDRDLTLVLGPDETLEDGVGEFGQHFFGETKRYWHEWVRFLGIPFEWQDAVIRAAITLKLSAVDDTGAIIAAPTTSLPEAPASSRNWDYRYCWLRDGYFVVNALNRLSVTGTMERYLHFITSIAATHGARLQPVYRISGRPDMDENSIPNMQGFRGMGPVRVGNAAYHQVQNDVYGSVILAASHVFFDQRLEHRGDESLFHRLEDLGELAREVYDKPDAGLWELRNSARVHTFSSVMCWVACDRLSRIAAHIGLADRAAYWRKHADGIHRVICERSFDATRNTFVECFDGKDMDASLLLLKEMDFLAADDPRFAGTVAMVEKELKHGDLIYRYRKEDDFGRPETAFLVCTFWYIDALAALGRRDEARDLFEKMLSYRNPHGLLSEDVDPKDLELWGNFPQTYSMVGLIHSALRLSNSWENAF